MRGVWLSVLWTCGAAMAAFPAAAADQAVCDGKLASQARPPALVLSWTGEIRDPMAECIQGAFDRLAGSTRYIVLNLDSEGGSLLTTDRVIATLKQMQKTHPLQTVVRHGRKCWSACVPVFLVGRERYGALTSTWMFHEVWSKDRNGSAMVDRARSDRVFNDYFLAAGVSEAWLKRLYLLIPHSNYWQTGQNLWDDKSGIITRPLDNLVPNYTERPIR